MNNDQPQLTPFGQRFVRIIHEHKFATTKLMALCYDKSDSEVKNEVRRLRKKNILDSHNRDFLPKQVYYRFTEDACRLFGVSKRYAEPFGKQALRMRYGLLHFVATGTPTRRILLPSDLDNVWQCYEPDATEEHKDEPPNVSGAFFINRSVNGTEERFVLGTVLIDCRSAPGHLIKKAQSFVQARKQRTGFRTIVAKGEFSVTIVTETEGKSQAILKAAANAAIPFPIETHICPELGQL